MSDRFRYFEDYEVGQKGNSANRTVTEADAINFACLQGDYGWNLMDGIYMAKSMYGVRVI